MTEGVVRKLDFGRKLLLLAVGLVIVAKAATPHLSSVSLVQDSAREQVATNSDVKAPAFEVAVIRSSKPGGGTATQTWPGGRIVVRGATLRALVLWAYDIRSFQLFGGPAWFDSEQYDIDAKPHHPESNQNSKHKESQYTKHNLGSTSTSALTI